MEYAGNVSGNKPHVRKYPVDGGKTIGAGVPIQSGESIDNNSGVIPGTTVVCVGFMGCASASTSSTAAQTGTANNVNVVSTIINSDAMWRAKLSGDAAEDVDLLFASAAQATSNDGLTVTGLTDKNICWAYEGANVGIDPPWRRASGAATLTTAMPFDIVALDTFLYAPISIASRTQYVQLTTNVTQIDIDDGTVDSDNDNFIAVDFLLRDAADEGRSNSYAFLIGVNHAFGVSVMDE